MKLFLLFLFFISTAYAEQEWDCASNTGAFTRSTNCTITGNNHVAVTNMLEINGTNTDMNNLVTITAATTKRHFYLNNANAKLILRYLKLVGGDVRSYSSGPDYFGGSILILTNGGELNLYSSIVYNNKAIYGGGIHADGDSSTNRNAIMNIYNSVIQNNEVTDRGGGIYMWGAIATIDNTTIDNNVAYSSSGGGMGGGMVIQDSDVTMKNTIISNNNAGNDGGGLDIAYDSTVILRQSSFINNDARFGDEIYTSGSPTITLDNDIFKLDIYVSNNPRWNLNQSNYTGKMSNIKHLINMEKINKLEKLLGGCKCSASVLTGCSAGKEDKEAIIEAYKELNQC